MGRYFGLNNTTRKEGVSEGRFCWKADPNCDIHSVMHRYGWTCADRITSSAYDSAFRFQRTHTTMEPVEASSLSPSDYEDNPSLDNEEDGSDQGDDSDQWETCKVENCKNMSKKEVIATRDGYCLSCYSKLAGNKDEKRKEEDGCESDPTEQPVSSVGKEEQDDFQLENPVPSGGKDEDEDEQEDLLLGFQMPDEDVVKTSDHYPVWDMNHKCAICSYQFKQEDIVADSSKFRPVYYCN